MKKSFVPSGHLPKGDNQKITSVHYLPRFCSQCGNALRKKLIPIENCKRLCCSHCGFIAYLNPVPVAGIIPERDGKVLLLRRGIEPAKGKWTFPAGFVELRESIPQAALRETLEEIGMKVKLTGLVGVYSYPGFGVVTIVYSAKVVSGRFKTGLETQEIREFSKNSIPWKELAFRSTREALKDWLRIAESRRQKFIADRRGNSDPRKSA